MLSILVCQLLGFKAGIVASDGVVPAFVRRMAPHLCGVELDMVTKAVGQGKEAPEILKAISQRRRKLKIAVPKVWAIRRGSGFSWAWAGELGCLPRKVGSSAGWPGPAQPSPAQE